MSAAGATHALCQAVCHKERDEKQQEINSLTSKLSSLNEEIERKNRERYRIEDEVNKVITDMKNEVTASGEILQSEMVQQIVNAITGIGLNTDHDVTPVDADIAVLTSDDPSQEIIDRTFSDLTQTLGRDYSRNDVINYLICVSQGFMTTFAGLPGTGKTSLCNALAASLGLKNADAPRFTEISVEKGWTSYKDYIGYYNPLSHKNEMANAQIYNAFNMLNAESSLHDDKQRAPWWFLLDEANLSPLEHYWSPFLRACDTCLDKGMTLELGGDKDFVLPSYMRFLATVNFDHTTEALSPRFLDRSWVITLEPSMLDLDQSEKGDAAIQHDDVISYSQLMGAFGPRKAQEMDGTTEDLLNAVFNICQKYKMPVSPRSQRMMSNYICTALPLMDTQTKDTRNAPIDYAVSQKVLPLISGEREAVKGLLDELHETCSALSRTSAKIDRMIEAGDEIGYYQYFA